MMGCHSESSEWQAGDINHKDLCHTCVNVTYVHNIIQNMNKVSQTYTDEPSRDPPEQMNRRCSRVANARAISLLGASRFA